MGKINKNSNLYDKNGNFLHKPGKYTIEELEKLVDTLDKNSREFASATAILMHMYEQKGNPHRDELIQKLIEQSKTKTTKAEVINALKDVNITESNGSSNETDTTISTAAWWKGEFYKFIEVFGDSRINGKDVIGMSRDN